MYDNNFVFCSNIILPILPIDVIKKILNVKFTQPAILQFQSYIEDYKTSATYLIDRYFINYIRFKKLNLRNNICYDCHKYKKSPHSIYIRNIHRNVCTDCARGNSVFLEGNIL